MNTQKGVVPVAILVIVGFLLVGAAGYYLIRKQEPKLSVQEPLIKEELPQIKEQPLQPDVAPNDNATRLYKIKNSSIEIQLPPDFSLLESESNLANLGGSFVSYSFNTPKYPTDQENLNVYGVYMKFFTRESIETWHEACEKSARENLGPCLVDAPSVNLYSALKSSLEKNQDYNEIGKYRNYLFKYKLIGDRGYFVRYFTRANYVSIRDYTTFIGDVMVVMGLYVERKADESYRYVPPVPSESSSDLIVSKIRFR